jgi:hypothetical protein
MFHAMWGEDHCKRVCFVSNVRHNKDGESYACRANHTCQNGQQSYRAIFLVRLQPLLSMGYGLILPGGVQGWVHLKVWNQTLRIGT